jgi:hypothetical protein
MLRRAMRLSFSNNHNSICWKIQRLLVLLTVACAPAISLAQDKDGGAGNDADVPAIVVDVAPETPPAPAENTAGDADTGPDVVFGGDALPINEESKPVKLPPKVRSLFFSAKDMAAIRKAVGVYTRIAGEGANAMDFLNRLQTPEQQEKKSERYFVYPQFFLASLVYNTPEDWTVYINNQRLTHKNPESSQGLRVKSIDKDKVAFEWMPDNWRKVEDVWSVMPNKDIEVDGRKSTVMFTLRPNQTFSSYVMRVLEGKVMPMVLDLAPKAKEGEDGKPTLNVKPSPDNGPTERDFLDNLLGKGR